MGFRGEEGDWGQAAMGGGDALRKEEVGGQAPGEKGTGSKERRLGVLAGGGLPRDQACAREEAWGR